MFISKRKSQWKVILCGPTLEHDSIGKGLVEVVKKKLTLHNSSMTDHDQDPNVLFKITTITSAIEAVKRLPKMSKPFDLDSIEGLNVKPIKDYVEDFLVQDHE